MGFGLLNVDVLRSTINLAKAMKLDRGLNGKKRALDISVYDC